MSVAFRDQLGDVVQVDGVPQRIVSLVPSQTELLFDLGVGDRLVGVTRFCTDPPEKVAAVARVGGTKNFSVKRIDALNPDLILGNKEENTLDGIEQLKRKYPVWMSDIYDLDDALGMVEQIATMVGCEQRGEQLSAEIRSRFASLAAPALKATRPRAAYFIWRKPYMAVGGHNFIDHLMQCTGLDNVFADLERYPEVSPDQITAARPDVLLLSSEPFPFTEKHVAEFSELLPEATVLTVDGTLFSWYGSRLVRVPAYLRQIREQICATNCPGVDRGQGLAGG